jgi:hypothetical protein
MSTRNSNCLIDIVFQKMCMLFVNECVQKITCAHIRLLYRSNMITRQESWPSSIMNPYVFNIIIYKIFTSIRVIILKCFIWWLGFFLIVGFKFPRTGDIYAVKLSFLTCNLRFSKQGRLGFQKIEMQLTTQAETISIGYDVGEY